MVTLLSGVINIMDFFGGGLQGRWPSPSLLPGPFEGRYAHVASSPELLQYQEGPAGRAEDTVLMKLNQITACDAFSCQRVILCLACALEMSAANVIVISESSEFSLPRNVLKNEIVDGYR